MYDLEILTKHNTIHISVVRLQEIKEVLLMPYVLSYEVHRVAKPKYKMLVKTNALIKTPNSHVDKRNTR